MLAGNWNSSALKNNMLSILLDNISLFYLFEISLVYLVVPSRMERASKVRETHQISPTVGRALIRFDHEAGFAPQSPFNNLTMIAGPGRGETTDMFSSLAEEPF